MLTQDQIFLKVVYATTVAKFSTRMLKRVEGIKMITKPTNSSRNTKLPMHEINSHKTNLCQDYPH
jgi:hypothetical protein